MNNDWNCHFCANNNHKSYAYCWHCSKSLADSNKRRAEIRASMEDPRPAAPFTTHSNPEHSDFPYQLARRIVSKHFDVTGDLPSWMTTDNPPPVSPIITAPAEPLDQPRKPHGALSDLPPRTLAAELGFNVKTAEPEAKPPQAPRQPAPWPLLSAWAIVIDACLLMAGLIMGALIAYGYR